MANTTNRAGSRIFATVKSFFALTTGIVAYVAPADVWVWTGAQDAYWTNAANWTVNGAVATTPPGRFLCDGADSGAFNSSVEFGDVASGAATTIDLDGFRDVSNLVVSAGTTRYQFGTSNAQSLTIHSTAGVFRVQSGALAPVMTAQFGAWRYGAKPSAGLNDAGTAKIVNDSEDVLEFPKMFYVEYSARSGEKPIRFEGSGDIKISGLCTARCLIYLDLAQTDGGKIIWNCKADGDWRSRFRKIRNAAGYVSEIELLEGAFLSGYTGMGPFDISGTLTLSGTGEYQCNVGKKGTDKATDGNLYLDQQNTVNGTMYVRCRVTSYENNGYFGGWTIYGGTGTTYFDGDIDNEMLGDAKILVTSDSSAYENRPTFSVGEIGIAGEQGPLGMAGVTISGGGRLLYTGTGETCTRPFCITNRVPRLQNSTPIDMNPCAMIEQGGTGKLTFNSPIVSYGLCLKGTTVRNATLELANSTSQEAEIGTVLSDNVDSGTLSLVKKGSGMWRLAKANGYTGATTIHGGALVLGAEGSVSTSSSLTMKGGDLVLESDSGAARSVSIPAISISSGVNRIMVADGVSVTAAGLSVGAGTLDVQVSGSGSFAVTGLSEVPSGVTIGGRPAAVGADGKFVLRGYDADVEIAARGGKIPSASGETVGITSSGNEDDGPVALEDGVTSATIGALVQKSATPATVALSAGQTLSAGVVAVEAGRAALTVGSEAGTGTLTSAGDIEFDNMSGNPLTVLTSLSVPSSSSISAMGTGLTRLWWPSDWAGMLKVSNGTLALTNDSDIAFTSTLGGTGEFRKEGSGVWTMAKPQDTTFSGDFTIAGGEVSFGDNRVFGSMTEGKVTVADGATLKPTTYELSIPPAKKLHLSGRGPSGEGGALDLGTGLFYAPDVELDGDTRVVSTSSDREISHLFFSDKKISGKLDMNGHSLNIATNIGLDLYSVKVTDPGAFVYEPFDVYGNKWCMIYLYNDCDLGGESAPCIEATVGSRMSLDELVPPVRRKFRVTIPTDSKYPEASFTGGMAGQADGVNTNFAQWAGPVEIVNAGTILSFNPWDANNADRYITVSGKISGAGDIHLGYGTKSGTKGHVLFTNPANTYTGSTVVNFDNGSSLTFFRPGSLPDWSKLTVYGSGRIGVVAGEDFFSVDDIIAAANSSVNWNVSSTAGCRYLPNTLAVNTSYLPGQSLSMELSDTDITRVDGGFSIGHDGKGELTLTGSWTKPVRFSCFDGVLKYTGEGVKTLGAGVISGNRELSVGEVLIEDAADIRFTQNQSVILGGYGHVVAEGRLTIRDSRVTRLPPDGQWNDQTSYDSTVVGVKGTGIVSIEGNSVVTNRHVAGMDSEGRGAVYLRGGRLVEYCPDTSVYYQSSTVGNFGYGYFEVAEGSVCDICGRQYLGLDSGGQGVFVQKGGVVDRSKPWKSGYDNNWTLASGNGSVAVVMLEGGVHTNASDTSICNGPDSRAYFTIEGGEYINLRPANPNRAANADSLTVINLNGGVFSAWNVAKARASYPEGVVAGAYVNFDGGTFLGMKNNYSLFGRAGAGSWSEAVDRVTVYGGGAVIDIADGITQYADVSLSAPTGNGVASVAWSDTGVKYVGSPVVEIIGDGTGASAFAEFDSVNRKVTGIKVTSAGCDYTWAKAVIRYGNEAAVTNTAVTLAPQTSGSFTKKGPGTLCLNVANSYGGDTVVEDGMLIVNTASAIPEGSKIVLKGGVIVTGTGVSIPASVFRFDLLDPVAYPGEFGFPEGSSIEIVNLDKVDKSVGSYVLATFDGGLSGVVPEVSNKDDLPPRWYLLKSGKSLKVRYSRGSVVSFR